MVSFDEETAQKLLTQVEFYFSDSNLPRDEFLSKEVRKGVDGMVSLQLVCSFSRMRILLDISRGKVPTYIVVEVADILRTSDFLKVSDDGLRIGRGTKLSKPKEVLEKVDRRTIAASPFEHDTEMEDVVSFFSRYAKLNSVRLPHHVGDKELFCGTVLVEFSSEQEAQDFLKQRLVYAGVDLELTPKREFDKQREGMIKELEYSVPSNKFQRGQVLKFTLRKIGSTGEKKEKLLLVDDKADQLVVPAWSNCEIFKEVFDRFGSVKHVEYSGGMDSGYVCFKDSRTATKARAAVEFIGGLIVKNTFSVVLEEVDEEMDVEVWRRLPSSAKQ